MSDGSSDDKKNVWISLATMFGIAGLAALINQTLERRDRIHENLELTKKGKGLGALWERQEAFEQGLARFQDAQHKHFEGVLRESAEGLARAMKEEVAKINERIEALAATKPESSNPPN